MRRTSWPPCWTPRSRCSARWWNWTLAPLSPARRNALTRFWTAVRPHHEPRASCILPLVRLDCPPRAIMRRSEYARFLALFGAFGTIAGLLLWASQATTGRSSDWLIVAGLFALPMIFIVIGLARRRTYTAAWASMLAVLYVGYALAEHLINDGAAGVWLTL